MQVPILDGNEAERATAKFTIDRLDLFHEAMRSIFECLETVSLRYCHPSEMWDIRLYTFIYVYDRL